MDLPKGWQRVWNLHEAGYSVREIGFRLDLTDRTVRDYLSRVRALQIQTEVEWTEWEREAERRAEVYTDPQVKAWIWERMRRWASK